MPDLGSPTRHSASQEWIHSQELELLELIFLERSVQLKPLVLLVLLPVLLVLLVLLLELVQLELLELLQLEPFLLWLPLLAFGSAWLAQLLPV